MSFLIEGGPQRVHISVQPMPEMGRDANLHLVVLHRIGTPLQIGSDPDSVTVFPDAITERKQFEKSLETAREITEAATRSKNSFLANMIHESRSPMTAILGYIDLVAAKVHDHETSSYVRTIRRNGDFLLEIINDILDLSKIEAGKHDIAQETFAPLRLIEDIHGIQTEKPAPTTTRVALLVAVG